MCISEFSTPAVFEVLEEQANTSTDWKRSAWGRQGGAAERAQVLESGGLDSRAHPAFGKFLNVLNYKYSGFDNSCLTGFHTAMRGKSCSQVLVLVHDGGMVNEL